jgi:ATP-dependent DNA ligase
MLAQKITHVPTGEEWLIEPKYDGWRALAHIHDEVHLETRTGNQITQVPYLATALAYEVPPGTILDGEIVDLSGGRQWNRTQTILSTTRNGYQHQPSATDPELSYVLFDILALEGTDLRDRPLSDRKQSLRHLFKNILDPSVTVLAVAPTEDASEEALHAILAAGFEGAVIKHRDSRYVCGARGGGAWYKLKPDAEVEAICTGFYPAEPGSKYAPLDSDGQPQPWAVGGLCFRVEHNDGRAYEGRAAGMDDELRRTMHEDPSPFIGLIVEIGHRGVEDSGSLRHPQFKRFRAQQEKPRRRVGPATARGISTRRASQGIAVSGKRRMRNYRAMRDEKLRACLDSLRARSGDAYERCLTAGSGDSGADLAEIERLTRERRLD